jgi:HTH-type transcriptional regulator, sugar sensing transcriptional regulator
MNKDVLEIKEILVKSGFSENESAVFLSLLQLGKGTVSQITRKAGLNRTTGYDILDSLVAKGLASVSGKEPKQEYLAESPDHLLIILENNAREAGKRISEIKKIIPELKSIHNVAGRPKVRFYEGTQGLIDVYEDTLTSSESIRAYATIDDMHKALPNYFPEYYKRRAQKGINIRGIVPKTATAIERSQHNEEEKREITFVSTDKYYFSPEIDIYDNKVMIASWREKLGIIIESAEIADAMKKIYELAWIGAKEEAKNKESANINL